jgi:hypothetical protein
MNRGKAFAPFFYKKEPKILAFSVGIFETLIKFHMY